MKSVFFKDQNEFRKWLAKNHLTSEEILVGFFKKGSGKLNMTWSESVDQALCFGWIDSVRRSIDAESYCIRFTPRKKSSIWSRINIEKVERLSKAGLMHASGMEAFGHRTEEKSRIYSFEKAAVDLSPELEKKFKSNKVAYANFYQKTPSFRKQMIHWIMDAKREETRMLRLGKLMVDLGKG